METFEQYLVRQDFTPKRILDYNRRVQSFLRENPTANKFQYSDLINYLNQESKYSVSQYVRMDRFLPIKKYYDYLIDTRQRVDHPCRTLYVKAPKKKGVVFADLFTSSELEKLFNREEKFEHLKVKNQLIISFLIYQGLLSKEIVGLKLKDIDLDVGTVHIKGGKQNAARTIELHPKQYSILNEYLESNRKRLLETRNIKTDYLLLNFRGKPITTNDVNFVITYQNPFPGKAIKPKIIRDSVIANLLNERKLPLEQVQLFAGHRWISCTARYKHMSVQEQRKIMNQFHPLK